jgi:hypothetical protein
VVVAVENYSNDPPTDYYCIVPGLGFHSHYVCIVLHR